MSDDMTLRPALGQIASIGTLYNARTDSFLPSSLLKGELPPDAIIRTEINQTEIRVGNADTYEDKFEKMGVSSELGASVLAGLVTPVGSGLYLSDRCEIHDLSYPTLYHKLATVQEKLNFMSVELKDCLALRSFHGGEATHVVTGIEWGSQSVVTASHREVGSGGYSDPEHPFPAELETFRSTLENSNLLNSSEAIEEPRIDISPKLTVYSDVLAENTILTLDFQQAYEFLENMPHSIKAENYDKGQPIAYTLLPIGMLALFLPVEIQNNDTPVPLSADILKNFSQLFDQVLTAQQKLNDYSSYILQNELYVEVDHAQAVAERVRSLKIREESLKSDYARVLKSVRYGINDPRELWQLLQDHNLEDFSPSNIARLSDGHREKVEFVKRMVAQNATYIGDNDIDLDAALLENRDVDCYVMAFSKAAMRDDQSWNQNEELLLELLSNRKLKAYVAILDCDAVGLKLEKARIGYFLDQQEITPDLVERRRFLANTCFVQYDEPSLDVSDFQKPLMRRFVKIACPGPECDQDEVCDWICSQCHTPIEYGYTDEYIYCDCGRSLFSNYKFKCKSDRHTQGFVKHDQAALLSLLKNLSSFGNMNILILGETGVGKSTFINALVNYLAFETLNDSLEAEGMNWVVPCSFTTNIVDSSKPKGEIRQIKVEVGSRYDECDSFKGQSATQQTTVYPVTIGTTTIRLIDTPGIGDTRGFQQDSKNIADILSTISSYDELHGILILLKANTTRLTIQFRWCLKELLTHMHRDAAKNVAFGFTNTRISNHLPGDAFNTLHTLLADHSDAGLDLSTNTAYCFDSEGFRYLSAYKNETVLGNIEEFHRSWEHSRAEAVRLLHHFRAQSPHLVKSTIILNRTREMISELVKPMAEASELIAINIARSKDKITQLRIARLISDSLRNRLFETKIQLKHVVLDKPRMTCCDPSCTEYKSYGHGENSMTVAVHKHCHRVCFLNVNDMATSTVGRSQIVQCAAFSGSDFCTRCSHNWSRHVRELTETKVETRTVKDSGIEMKLKAHLEDIVLCQAEIKSFEHQIEELSTEYSQIQRAVAQFALFVQKHSTVAVNDAMAEYLDRLIAEEAGQVHLGRDSRKHDGLMEDRANYLKMMDVLAENIQDDPNYQPLTDEVIDQVIRELCNLKHFGAKLETVRDMVSNPPEPPYRELPFRVPVSGSRKASPFEAPYTPRRMMENSSGTPQPVTTTELE